MRFGDQDVAPVRCSERVIASGQLPRLLPARHDPAGRAGSASLRVERVAGRSAVVEARAASPLRLVVTRPQRGVAWVFTSTFGGGLVDGDAIALDVEVREGARLLLTTQASTKVYKSPRGTRSALSARVGPDALLVSWPDPVACFASARYAQSTTIELAERASLVAVETVTAGRVAHGEQWSFARYRSDLRVARGGRAFAVDALALDAAHGSIADRMGRFEALATVILAGPACEPIARAASDAIAASPVEKGSDLLEAASPIDTGAILRIAGTSIERVAARVRERLEGVAAIAGGDPWARKW